jgi:hypothetical protein
MPPIIRDRSRGWANQPGQGIDASDYLAQILDAPPAESVDLGLTICVPT